MDAAATTPPLWSPADEGRHTSDGSTNWREEWAFWFWSPDGEVGGYTGLSVLGGGQRTWYWAAFVRAGQPLLTVCELGGPALRRSDSLLLKAEGLWADHHVEDPFVQWTVQNECFAVALDDPDDVFGRPYGVPTPIAFDLEWYAASGPELTPGGYHQYGEIDAVIELPGRPVTARFNALFRHRWGTWPAANDQAADPSQRALRAPLLIGDAKYERWMTAQGWSERLLPYEPAPIGNG